MTRKLLILLIFLLALVPLHASTDQQNWHTGTLRFNICDRLALDAQGELRLTKTDFYYNHFQYMLEYAVSEHWKIGVGRRAVHYRDTNAWEYHPTLSIKAGNKFIENRMLVILRRYDHQQVLRIRNKFTVTIHRFFFAQELFTEGKGRGFFQQRYYWGLNVANGLSAYLMYRIVEGKGMWIAGTCWGAEF